MDLTSLETYGPVRVKIGCENPQIELEKLTFLNGDGHIIRFVVEKYDGNNNPPSQDPLHRFEVLIGREMRTKKKMRKKMITTSER